MLIFNVLSAYAAPELWVFRVGVDRDLASSQLAYDATPLDEVEGFRRYAAELDGHVHAQARAQLHTAGWQEKEADVHIKTLPRSRHYRFPSELWLVQGVRRVLPESPFASAGERVRIHLVTRARYAQASLFIWTPGGAASRIERTAHDELGPYFDVALEGQRCHLFCFKFVDEGERFEPDHANRLYAAADGAEVWVHPEVDWVASSRPKLRPLIVHALGFPGEIPAQLLLTLPGSSTTVELAAEVEPDGWLRYETNVYTGLEYRALLRSPGDAPVFEHEEATRNLRLAENGAIWTQSGDSSERVLGKEVWTLAFDHELFSAKPTRSKVLELVIAASAPGTGLSDAAPLLDVWVNRSNALLESGVRAAPDGVYRVRTYPDVVTSFRFRGEHGPERLERHTVKIDAEDAELLSLFVVLGRADALAVRPPADLFRDPPWEIRRPGTWEEAGMLRFSLHCPRASAVSVIAEFTHWEADALELRSTLDGAYWWGELPVASVQAALGTATIDGALYKFFINQVLRVQDPAADWVENSDPDRASKLVDHALYEWRSNAWQRPGWEYLIVYQVHPSRLSQRTNTSGLDGVTREVRDPQGYVRQLGATAVLLMPTCEFAGDRGWGYNPSFFYSVESSYGGPAALKRLVDACHEQGLAVLLDVVFNHAGTSDNVLWAVASESYFDGDTDWGALINFDHPQVCHFFEQNLIHFMKHYRVDGFRFDFTRVIRFGDVQSAHIRKPGSGGGWEFMQRLRRAVDSVDSRCLLMAENLPNDWDLTHKSGPMHTQWSDAFHDRLVEAVSGAQVLGALADAMKVTHSAGDDWYQATFYPESHDEVGNEPQRITHVAGPGQGFRRSKVAAAATLFGRGIPLFFMGAEAGEWRQFSKDGNETLDLTHYETDASARQLRRFWRDLCQLRRGNPRIEGPAPLRVHFAEENLLAFSRGEAADLFVVLNFGHAASVRSLSSLNLPEGHYKELLNSTWGEYRIEVEAEDEHGNGGWGARLGAGDDLNVPDYGVIVLERE